MAGIFVRGLTGNKVNVFVDGVRYSNGAQRGGVNTFLDLIEPEWLESIEILRGPSSAQYGSDALGGSVQFLSRAAVARRRRRAAVERLVRRRRRHRASRTAAATRSSAYMGRRSGMTASIGGRKTGLIRTGRRRSTRTRRSRGSSASRPTC